MEIAISADRDEDLAYLESVVSKISSPIILRREDLIDLLLRERISWFDRRKPPDVIIASYREFFTDLKVIADLKKIPGYQWVKVILLVSEDISRTKSKFIQFGVTDVLEWKAGDLALRKFLTEKIKQFATSAIGFSST